MVTAAVPPRPSPPPSDRSKSLGELLVTMAAVRERHLCNPSDASLRAELDALYAELARRTPPPKTPVARSPLDAARAVADVGEFEVPPSHRKTAKGKLITAGKSVAVGSLSRLLRRYLAPQARFNQKIVAIADRLVAASASGQPLPESVAIRRALYGALGETQSGSAGLFPTLLSKQNQYNAQLVELLALAAQPELPDVKTANRLVKALAELCDPVVERQGALKAATPILREVFRRQNKFNSELMLVMADLLHGRPPVVPPQAADYADFRKRVDGPELEEARQKLGTLKSRPLVSIVVPAYNTPAPILEACIESVRAQLYDRWELCIVDDGSPSPVVTEVLKRYSAKDPRIKHDRLAQNAGIGGATNAAIALATGEWIAFLDHDDKLAPHALVEMLARVEADPSLDWVYSDEDRLSPEGERHSPFFKPDYSPELLRSVNYICHFVFVRAPLVKELQIRDGFQGSQDYDFLLRLAGKTEHVAHIPKILYHWRSSSLSLSSDWAKLQVASDNGMRALKEHLQAVGEPAEVTCENLTQYKVRYPVQGEPLVSIIVPFKDKPELLSRLVETLLRGTRYRKYELLLVSNNSVDPRTYALLDSFTDARIRKLRWDHPFNYPAINNYAAKQANGELLLFLNNDMEVTDPLWMEELISHAQRPSVGAVGPKLRFPDDSIQHAGVVVGICGYAGHPFWRFPTGMEHTCFGSAVWNRNYLAVTSACVMMRRELFERLGGYDERFAVCGSDVDLCLRAVESGLRVVYAANTWLYHHESASRRNARIPEGDYWHSIVRYRRWLENGDPFYNPNLTLAATDCSLKLDEPSAVELAAQAVLALRSANAR